MSAPHPARPPAVALMRELQDHIIAGLEAVEAGFGSDKRFGRDEWQRDGGGGGRTRVLEGGAFLEKGGVNVSEVHGQLDDDLAKQLPGKGTPFFATGVSLVLHPQNPHVPTVHANFRHIQQGEKAWFGGGADLTPYYYHPEDRDHFHAVWKTVCDEHRDVADHKTFADACDRYFYLPHRGERRGVGGIFFDHVMADAADPGRCDAVLAFIRAAGYAFLDAYLPIVRRRSRTPYTPAQREWQELRRGRYVEFNLLCDRGTVFGLKTNGRTESILMSLPPRVRWGYAAEPAAGTPEAELLDVLREPLRT